MSLTRPPTQLCLCSGVNVRCSKSAWWAEEMVLPFAIGMALTPLEHCSIWHNQAIIFLYRKKHNGKSNMSEIRISFQSYIWDNFSILPWTVMIIDHTVLYSILLSLLFSFWNICCKARCNGLKARINSSWSSWKLFQCFGCISYFRYFPKNLCRNFKSGFLE